MDDLGGIGIVQLAASRPSGATGADECVDDAVIKVGLLLLQKARPTFRAA